MTFSLHSLLKRHYMGEFEKDFGTSDTWLALSPRPFLSILNSCDASVREADDVPRAATAYLHNLAMRERQAIKVYRKIYEGQSLAYYVAHSSEARRGLLRLALDCRKERTPR